MIKPDTDKSKKLILTSQVYKMIKKKDLKS